MGLFLYSRLETLYTESESGGLFTVLAYVTLASLSRNSLYRIGIRGEGMFEGSVNQDKTVDNMLSWLSVEENWRVIVVSCLAAR